MPTKGTTMRTPLQITETFCAGIRKKSPKAPLEQLNEMEQILKFTLDHVRFLLKAHKKSIPIHVADPAEIE